MKEKDGCPKCASPIQADSEFCDQCGGNLHLSEESSRKGQPGALRDMLAAIAISLGFFFLIVGVLLFLLELTGAGKLAGLWIVSVIGGAGLLLGGKGIRTNSRGFVMALLLGNGCLIGLGLFYVNSNGGPEWIMRNEPYVGWPLLGLIVLELIVSPLAFPDPIETLRKREKGEIDSSKSPISRRRSYRKR